MTDHLIFTARLPPADSDAMRAFAALSGISMNTVVLRALRSYLRGHADDAALADAAEVRHRRFLRAMEELGAVD
jgi:hypothetical protein